jgi:hypothetical protein
MFVDEGVPALKGSDFAFIIVDTDYRVPHLCKTDGGNKAYVSGTDHGDWNRFTHSLWEIRPPVLGYPNSTLSRAHQRVTSIYLLFAMFLVD